LILLLRSFITDAETQIDPLAYPLRGLTDIIENAEKPCMGKNILIKKPTITNKLLRGDLPIKNVCSVEASPNFYWVFKNRKYYVEQN